MQSPNYEMYESHSWKMVWVGNNKYREPIFAAMCEECQKTIPEAIDSSEPCGGLSDFKGGAREPTKTPGFTG